MSDTLTSTIRCEIVKPLDMSWDDLGRSLRAWSMPMHRVLNHAITALELGRAGDSKVHPQTRSYREVGTAWEAERKAAADRLERGKPYGGDDAIAEIEPGSVLRLGAAGLAYARWAKFDKERWRGTMSLPTFRAGAPICIAGGGGRVGLDVCDGAFVISLPMFPRGRGRVRLVVRPYGGSGFADMRRLVEGLQAPEDAPNGIKVGDCRIVHDSGKWQAMVSWTRPRPAALAGGRVMAIRRGMSEFLIGAIASTDHREAKAWSETGDDLLRHKLAYKARRRSLGEQRRQSGAGARGHGETRRLEHITRLEDAEARWVQSKCREVAAHAVNRARAAGVSTILIEDFGAIRGDGDAPIEAMIAQWPFAQLKECIAWVARREGIAVREVSVAYNARRCPLCKTMNEESTSRVFRCSECKLERERGLVVAWNMSIDADAQGPRHPHDDAKRAAKRTRERIKRAA